MNSHEDLFRDDVWPSERKKAKLEMPTRERRPDIVWSIIQILRI